MAHNYKKLSDVTLVDSLDNPNVLVEDNGEIIKVSASKLQANWDEEDNTSPAFILNKPDLSKAGGAKVVTYEYYSDSLRFDGTSVSAESIVDEWNNGSILRVDNGGSHGLVLNLSYWLESGSINSVDVFYTYLSSIEKVTVQ